MYELNIHLFGEESGEVSSEVAAPATGEVQTEVAAPNTAETPTPSIEDRRKNFRALIEGEYKDLYTEETQAMINKRFKASKAQQATIDSYKPIIDALADRFSETDTAKILEKLNGETSFWRDAAAEAGFDDVEKFKEFQKLRRENAERQALTREEEERKYAENKMKEWMDEAKALKEKYPSFNFEEEMKDRSFVSSIKSGVPMEVYFKGKHYDDLAAASAIKVEKAVTDNIKARGSRPTENGASSQGGYEITNDVSKLTNEQRLELVKKARRGETVEF